MWKVFDGNGEQVAVSDDLYEAQCIAEELGGKIELTI